MIIDTLSERDRQIAILKAGGVLQNREIAERVGCGINTVTRMLQKSKVQEAIREIQESTAAIDDTMDLHEAIDIAAIDAYRTLSYLAKHAKSEQIRFRAASEILDWASADVAPKRQIHTNQPDGDRFVQQIYIDGRASEALQRIVGEVGGDDWLKQVEASLEEMPPSIG